MSAPFSTELVMNRANVKWYATLDTRYYLYPVHISLSFMFTPTLASALYLLLLRFQYRCEKLVYCSSCVRVIDAQSGAQLLA